MFFKKRLYFYFTPVFLMVGVCAGIFSLYGATAGEYEDPPAETGESTADLVILNGQVLTVDREFTIAEAVAVRDGIIVAAGSNDEIESHIGNSTQVIQAGGRTVIPGLIETHTHATSVVSRELAAGRPFEQLTSIEEIQNWLRDQVEVSAPGEWIRLPRVDVTRIREGRIPIPDELDEAAPDHPAVFIWQYADRQIQILNSSAMKAAGINRETRPPEGGIIHLNPDGEPGGRIENSGELTARFLPQAHYTEEEYLENMERLLGYYNRVGITSIFDRGSNEDGFFTYQRMQREGRLPVRVTVTMRLQDLDGSDGNADEVIGNLGVNFSDGDDHVRVGPLKFRMDGGILYGTAYMRDPFGEQSFDLYGIDDPEYHGTAFFTPTQIENILYAGHKQGWQMSAHVTGDAGVDLILDALEAVNARLPGDNRDHRFTLIHAYFPHHETARRVRQLGTGIDTQPAWLYMDGDALLNALGMERMGRFIGLRKWQQAGAKVSINSDHMQGFDPNTSLNPYNPFLTMYAAVSRRTINGRQIAPEQIISRLDALRMMTIDAAWFSFDEDKKGSIEAGKFADLVILSDDFLHCEEESIKDIRSLLTIVGGEIVFQDEEIEMH